MKIRSINSNELCNKARYNENITSPHLQITKSSGNSDKKDYASIMLLSLMDERGLFDIAFSRIETDESLDIVNELFNSASSNNNEIRSL